jgi:hypothetical protein
MANSGWNMYVFREGRKTLPAETLRNRLLNSISRYSETPSEDACIAALIAAGELECALADANSVTPDSPDRAGAPHPPAVSTFASVTDALADALVRRRYPSPDSGTPHSPAFGGCDSPVPDHLVATVSSLHLPEFVQLAVPEGFAYYALHPRKLVELTRTLARPASARVVGLRTIGTTLSAVVASTLRHIGVPTSRITVRPAGHPYDRKFHFTDREQRWLRSETSAQVFIVDEGPGISGSSFLAVAEAAEGAGVPRDRISILGSRWPDPASLRAPCAAERWPRFHFRAVSPAPILPPGAVLDVGGGAWRSHIFSPDSQPATWTQLESAKYMSADGHRLFKFHGYGDYGEAIAARAAKLASARFSPPLLALETGFGVYDFIPGRTLAPSDLSPELLHRLAEYCAFRAREFRSNETAPELSTMAAWNWQCEFGTELTPPPALEVQMCVIADARMLPHEWLRTGDGRTLKLDAVSHGDDHFFPGPCDIAWDLAGAIIEWRMDPSATAAFLDHYQKLSGDNPADRLPDYLLACSIFRMAWSKMAAQASLGMPDEPLLRRDYLYYREKAQQLSHARISHAPTVSAAD